MYKFQDSKFKIQRIRYHIVYVLCSMFFVLKTNAQCAMCRAVLESEGSTAKAEGINDGIVYLMAIPYLLVFVIGYIIYWQFFRKPKKTLQ